MVIAASLHWTAFFLARDVGDTIFLIWLKLMRGHEISHQLGFSGWEWPIVSYRWVAVRFKFVKFVGDSSMIFETSKHGTPQALTTRIFHHLSGFQWIHSQLHRVSDRAVMTRSFRTKTYNSTPQTTNPAMPGAGLLQKPCTQWNRIYERRKTGLVEMDSNGFQWFPLLKWSLFRTTWPKATVLGKKA